MKTIVGFLSRSHGLATLQQLLDENNFKIIHIFTHSKKPKSEDPERKIRDDFHLYEEICEKNNVPQLLVSKLLHAEHDAQGMTRHSEVYKKLNKILSEEWREDVDEIINDLKDQKDQKKRYE